MLSDDSVVGTPEPPEDFNNDADAGWARNADFVDSICFGGGD